MPPQPVAKWEGTGAAVPMVPPLHRVNVQAGITTSRFALTGTTGSRGPSACKHMDSRIKKTERNALSWYGFTAEAAGSGQGITIPAMGSNLAKNGDVVVVTLNHRLNALGTWTSLPSETNMLNRAMQGYSTLVAALQWVNKNIASFGGDAQNVTIFGQSGGGGKVSRPALLATPSARGCFTKPLYRAVQCCEQWK